MFRACSQRCSTRANRFQHLSKFPENDEKTPKSSVPVLSVPKPWFPQGFSHFWPIALEFCSAHATRCMAPAALLFASRTPNRVVFRVARVAKTLGFCIGPVLPRTTPVEAVGFELGGNELKLGNDQGRANHPVTLSKICLILMCPISLVLESGKLE
jgi:hypothetical protein